MKGGLTALFALLPLASLAQAQLPLAGQTYVAKMGNACAETNTGGYWETFYYRLRFGRDSVAVTWIVQSVCSSSGQALTISTDTTQTQRYAYYLLDQPQQVAIPGFQLAALTPTTNGLLSALPLSRGYLLAGSIQTECGSAAPWRLKA